MRTRDIAEVGILAAVISALAPWAIPIGPVPVTLATFAVYLVSAVAGWKRGVAAVCVYILLGAVGIPVFSGLSGGAHRLIGATGGYIAGYIPCALIVGLVTERCRGRWRYPAAMALGTLACYALGTAWYMVQSGAPFSAALAGCVLPFLPVDAAKIAAASVLAALLHRRIVLRKI